MRRLSWVLALTTLLVAAAAVPAAADPKAEMFYMECTDGVPSGWITANSGVGLWTPGFAVDGTGVYIPHELEYTGTFYPADGGVWDLGTEVFVKNAPRNTKSHLHGTCTFGGDVDLVDDPDLGTGRLVFSAVARVFWTGR